MSMCSKLVRHSKRSGQQNWRDLYDHLITHRIFIFDNEWDLHTNSKNLREIDYMHNLDLLIVSH